MPKVPYPKISPDPLQVRIAKNFEVRYWMQALGVSRLELEAAVRAVGSQISEVRNHLQKAACTSVQINSEDGGTSLPITAAILDPAEPG